jgi:hypothetical protein
VASRSKTWVLGHSLARIAGSNPAVDMDSSECCVLSGRVLLVGPVIHSKDPTKGLSE